MSNFWLTALLLVFTPIYISFLGMESYALIGLHLTLISIIGVLDTGISATAGRDLAWLMARPEEKNKIPDLLISLELV